MRCWTFNNQNKLIKIFILLWNEFITVKLYITYISYNLQLHFFPIKTNYGRLVALHLDYTFLHLMKMDWFWTGGMSSNALYFPYFFLIQSPQIDWLRSQIRINLFTVAIIYVLLMSFSPNPPLPFSLAIRLQLAGLSSSIPYKRVHNLPNHPYIHEIIKNLLLLD